MFWWIRQEGSSKNFHEWNIKLSFTTIFPFTLLLLFIFPLCFFVSFRFVSFHATLWVVLFRFFIFIPAAFHWSPLFVWFFWIVFQQRIPVYIKYSTVFQYRLLSAEKLHVHSPLFVWRFFLVQFSFSFFLVVKTLKIWNFSKETKNNYDLAWISDRIKCIEKTFNEHRFDAEMQRTKTANWCILCDFLGEDRTHRLLYCNNIRNALK